MHIFTKLTALIMITLPLVFGAQTVLANEKTNHPNHEMIMLSVDINSISESELGIETVQSLLGLISSLRPEDDLYFTSMRNPNNYIGPFRVGDMPFKEFLAEVTSSLNNPGDESSLNLSQSLTDMYNLFDMKGATANSNLYLLSSGNPLAGGDDGSHFVQPISELFTLKEWKITGLTMGNPPQSIINAFTDLSETTSSIHIEINGPNGLKILADNIMSNNALGSLVPSGAAKLYTGDILTSKVKVAPGTETVKLVFFKEKPFGSLRLKNPSGVESTGGDRSSSKVLETPLFVVWDLVDPMPGIWTVDVKGIVGSVSSWYITSNKYRLNLNINEIVPTNQSTNIVAYVSEGDLMIPIGQDVQMKATITSPGGTSIVYQLNDDGRSGDTTAGDGYYSTTMPSPIQDGTYTASLELKWDNFDYSLSESSQFEAKHFPEVKLIPLTTDQLYPGQQVNIATAVVNIKDEPFAVQPEDLHINLGSNNPGEGTVELVPKTAMPNGAAWMYDVLFTPDLPGQQTLTIDVRLWYAEMRHSSVTNPLTLSTIALPEPPAPLEYKKTEPTAPVSPIITRSNTQTTSLPIELLGIPIAVIALILAGAMLQLSQTRPFGAMQNEHGDTIINFKELKRDWVSRIISPSVVRGAELNIAELKDLTFKFKGDAVEIHSDVVWPTIRLNNIPLVGKASLANQSWIGTGGKLFNFLTVRTN